MFEQTRDTVDPISTFQLSRSSKRNKISRSCFCPVEISRRRNIHRENVHLILIASVEVARGERQIKFTVNAGGWIFQQRGGKFNFELKCTMSLGDERGRTVNSDPRVVARRGRKKKKKKRKEGKKTRTNAKFFRVKGFRCPLLYFPSTFRQRSGGSFH